MEQKKLFDFNESFLIVGNLLSSQESLWRIVKIGWMECSMGIEAFFCNDVKVCFLFVEF